MNAAVRTYYEKMLDRLIPELKRRNIDAVYCRQREEACVTVLGMVPPGSTVQIAGSQTVSQCRIVDALESGPYQCYRSRVHAENDANERQRMRREATTADYCIGSLNAISLTGEIVNIDGGGSRIGGYTYGAEKVILVAGVNKITPTLEAALKRARTYSAVNNAIRLGYNSPCIKDGVCHNGECYPPDRICGKVLIIEKESTPGRITVAFVGEELGF